MPTVKGDSMRGLAVFISDIRNCKSKESEVKRINKELANIRSKFKGDKTIDGYHKKKYVCKLLFIFLLGHDIDFGHTEAVNLLCSNKYTEKQIGYLFISVLINESNTLMNLVIQRLKDDLVSRNPVFVTLALQCIANIGSREMAEHFAPEIPKLLVSGSQSHYTSYSLGHKYASQMENAHDTIDSVKQSAALCLLKLIRTAPDLVHFGEWTSRVIHLLNDQHMGVVTSAVSLIEALVRRNLDEYKGCVSLAVSRLSRIVTSSYTDLQDYTYYFVPAPWLSVKLLRLLQNYPPPEDPTVRSRLTECLDTILNKAQEPPKSKKVQHSNAKNAVLFEAINLIIHMDSDPNLLVRASNQLGHFLHYRETNLRYLGLESMCLLATSEFSHEAVKKHQETIINTLKSERDVSVRQRAVDLLYAMCDRSNAEEIVGEMLNYLETADYSIREEMVLKVAILAEKYATDYTWYVDTILNLIRIAGDYVSEEVWHRVIQIVINRDDVQGYAAKTVFEALQAPACHENMVKVGGYILGEFGNLIAGDPRSSPKIQFELLHGKYHLCTAPTRQLLLSTYVKFVNLFPEIRADIEEVLSSDVNLRNSNAEIQQRAVEYLSLSRTASTDVLATVLEEMPPFPERESSILAKLKQRKPATTEAPNRPGPTEGSTMPQAKISGMTNNETNATANSSQVLNLSSGDLGESEVDLLGLGPSPTVPSQTSDTTHSDNLFDFMGITSNSAAPVNSNSTPNGTDMSAPTGPSLISGNAKTAVEEDNFSKLITKNSGILFENDLIQIGLKAEFRTNLGRLGVYYGNKTQGTLTNFSTDVLHKDANLTQQAKIELKPVATTVQGGAQIQQLINVECATEFTEVPILSVHFMYSGAKQTLQMRLPLTLNKFVQPAEMNQTVFFQRWKQLSQPGQECQSIFQANFPMDIATVKTKIIGFGVSVLDGIDPTPSNFVSAGILHTSSQQIGVLLRLEPNSQTQMYRLTVRSTKETVSSRLVELLKEQI